MAPLLIVLYYHEDVWEDGGDDGDDENIQEREEGGGKSGIMEHCGQAYQAVLVPSQTRVCSPCSKERTA